MALTYVEYWKNNTTGSPTGGDVTSDSISVAVDDVITVSWIVENNSSDAAGIQTPSISNTGTALTWNNIANTGLVAGGGSNTYVRGWWARATAGESITITCAGSGSGAYHASQSVVVHTGAHATDPVPSGNIYSGTGANDYSQSVTPTAAGSCLWMAAGDWQANNALSAAANNTQESVIDSAQYTAAIIRPTTQPRTDASAFTIGEASDGTSETTAWIIFEVQAGDEGQLAYPTTDTTRDNWEEDDGTTTNIYDQIDEVTADDADYIRTQTAPSSDVYVTKFGTLTDPSSSTGHKVSVRYGKDSAGGDTVSLVAQLRQGYSNESSQGTLIATALNNTNISSGWTTATYTLTSGEADSITDYSSLYLRLVGNQEAVGYSTTPPSHGNTSAISTAGTTSTTITASTQSEGDLLLIAVESSDSTTAAGTPNTPANWSKIFEDTEGSGATGVTTLTIFARLAPAGGTGDVTVDGVLDHIAGSMMTITGHGVTTVGTDIVVGTAGKHGTGTTGLTTPGITVVANSLIVWAIGLSDDAADTSNASTYTNSNLASITERRDNTHATGAGGGIALATATCSGTTTGSGTWAHDTAVQSLSVYLGVPPPKAPRRAQVSWARLQVPTASGTPVTANPTGVAGTGAANTVTLSTGQTIIPTGVAATGAAGTATAATDQVIGITAAGATGAAGTVTVSISVDATSTPAGVAATGAANTVTLSTDQVFSIAGVGATGAAGTALATTPDVTLTLNGVAATGAVNTVTIAASVTAAITGEAAAGLAGTATATGGATATVTGAAATGAAGTGFSFVTNQTFAIAGVAATGALGTIQAISPDTTVIISGQAAAGLAGAVTLTTTATLALTGVAATGAAGTVTATATGDALATPAGVAATSAAGALSLTCDAAVSAVGASASGFAGAFAITGSANVGVTGTSAVAAVGAVLTTSELAGLILTVNALHSRTTCTRPAIEAPALAMTSRTVATRPEIEPPALAMTSRTTATRPVVTHNG